MKEKPNRSEDHQTTQASSFFKIDPQNWPDLIPPPMKPRQDRNPYKLLGVARLTDQTVQAGERLSTTPGWKIPQSKLVEPIRLRATELMLKLHSGEVERSQVLLFYKNNATAFISYRAYESYQDYAIKRKLKIMSWPEYARAVVLERFSEDFYAFRKWK